MKKDWLWDQDISEREIKEIFSDINDEKFISLSATLLSRKNSAKEVFTDYIKREDFFVSWQKIKKRMRKNSWNDPRIEYWQAIYETLKKEYPELVNLKQKKFEETLFPFYREKGKEIQEARKKLGLTQKEFAKKLGVSQQIISRIERGKQNLSYKTLEPICKQLGIPVDLDKKERPDATSTRHRLPFSNLSGNEFERLCYWVIKRSNEFEDVESYAGVGDKARDVIGYKYKVGKKETWYFQCKNYKKISPNDFITELDKIKQHSEENKDFKPDVIVFVTGCSVSANCKDKVKGYAKGNSFESVYFWTDVELDEKAKSTGADEEFFNKGISREDLTKNLEGVNQNISILSRQLDLMGLSEDLVRTDVINRDIDKTVKLIHKNELEKAKEELLKILGRIERNPDQYADELARTYNNLGICSIVSESEGGDLDKAEEYFNKALDIKPDFMRAKANLARVYFSRRGKNNFKKAYDIIRPLWEESDKKDSFVFLTFIWALHLHKSFKDAIEYYENSSEARLLTDQNEDLLNTMGNLYFTKGDFDKAEELVDQALTLSPHSPFSLPLKASIYLGRAQKEDIILSDSEVAPRFRDYRRIEEAKTLHYSNRH
jgi:transcriptional regulator with XRE-family HTH domain/Tfp pilus assembly protein PilF